jgi:DNA repair protein RadC
MQITSYEVNGKTYMTDSVGNLILEENVRQSREKINKPQHAIHFLSQERKADQENVVVLTLDGNNQLIAKHHISKGLVNSCLIHPREVFRVAIMDNAVSIMVAHNHPSGNTEASEADLIATKKLVDAGKLLGINLLDHIIVTSLEFTSIRERYPQYFF